MIINDLDIHNIFTYYIIPDRDGYVNIVTNFLRSLHLTVVIQTILENSLYFLKFHRGAVYNFYAMCNSRYPCFLFKGNALVFQHLL